MKPMKPCPSCKSTYLVVAVESHNPSKTRTFVECQNCDFQGPIVINEYAANNVDHAIDCWNGLNREGSAE